ncbi:MAG: hypothetical protein ACREQF_04510 [Candidatus Binataceae bacterium]
MQRVLARMVARAASMSASLAPIAQRGSAGRGDLGGAQSARANDALATVSGSGAASAIARWQVAQASVSTPSRIDDASRSSGDARGQRAGRERLHALAPYQLARPSTRGDLAHAAASSGISVTIHSAPTVVIQRNELASDELERRIVDALKAHREQLYSELEREFAQRRRAEFARV